jgi:hypothetical protein
MSVQQGKGHIDGISGGTIVFTKPDGTSLSGYVSPNLQSLRVTHSGKADEIKGQDGEYNSFLIAGEKLECEFNFIAEGTTKANARASAQFPPLGSAGTISGLPVIVIGSIADGLNGTWYYQGGGTDNGVNDGIWSGSFTLHRYPGITTTTAIT